MKLPLAPALLAKAAMETLLAPLRLGRERSDLLHRPVLVSVSQRAPQGWTPLDVFSAGKGKGPYRTFWGRPSEGFWLVGIGCATSLEVSGELPIRRASQAYNGLMAEALAQGPGIRGVGPVFMGGFRFDPRAPKSALWRQYPDGLLVLPRLLFTSRGEDRWLTTSFMVQPGADPRAEAERAIAEVESLDVDPRNEADQPHLLHQRETSLEEWTRWVQQAMRVIEDGYLAKVVLAREMTLCGEREFSLETVLSRLSEAYKGCSVFALDNGTSSFVGATPEAMVDLEEGNLSLSCLAGTAGRGATPEEDQRLGRCLLDSPKDRREHAWVVDTVAAALRGVCEELRWDTMPRLIKLPTVQHLATFFEGRPKAPCDVFRLVELLHPTPAVGGVPTEHALETICRLEGDRGWYAAPIGWLDHEGEGEFSVAIRSALLRGDQATLYAGSGIVQGSDPHLEFKETELKFRPLLSALVRSQP